VEEEGRVVRGGKGVKIGGGDEKRGEGCVAVRGGVAAGVVEGGGVGSDDSEVGVEGVG